MSMMKTAPFNIGKLATVLYDKLDIDTSTSSHRQPMGGNCKETARTR